MAATTKVFIDGVSPPSLQAADCNGYTNENNILISSTGQPLQVGDNKQTTEAVSNYASGGGYFYQDSGAANAYILSPVGAKLAPKGYFEGMHITFLPAASNTGASTVKIGLLSAVPLKTAIGGDLLADDLTTGLYTSAFYAGGEFRIIRSADPTSDLAEQLQTSFAIYGEDIGLVNALVVDSVPPYTHYVAGTYIRVKASLTTTSTTPTLNLNSLGAKDIRYTDGVPLVIGDIKAGGLYLFLYDGTNFQLLNPSRRGFTTTDQLQKSYAVYVAATGDGNNIIATPTPAYTAYVPGTRIIIKANATSTTSAPTIDISGQGSRFIVDERGAALGAGNLIAGGVYEFIYDGSAFQLRGTLANQTFSFSSIAQLLIATNTGFTSLLSTSVGFPVFPANFLKQGSAYKITLTGSKLINSSGSQGSQFRVKANGVVLATFNNPNKHNHAFTFELLLVFRQIGVPSTVFIQLDEDYFGGTPDFENVKGIVINTTDFNPTVGNVIGLEYEQSSDIGGGQLTVETVNVSQLF